MKDVIVIVLIIAAASPIVVSGVLAYSGKAGWGWFLFAGILLLGSFSYKGD